ncbi:MAG: UbiA family prenyltransferase [Vicinamibacterales bacterium]
MDGGELMGRARPEPPLPRPMGPQDEPTPQTSTRHAPVLPALIEGMRPQHWLKNLLVVVPLALSDTLIDLQRLADVAVAFVALCVVTGATYLINDIVDLPDDRRHWSKRRRPIASGRLSLTAALVAIPPLLLAGLTLAFSVSATTLGLVALYVVCTLAYSFRLKRLAHIDVLVLAGLFTDRVAIGIAAAATPPSSWLLVLAVLLFASLAYAKRYAELRRAEQHGLSILGGRGYQVTDAPIVLASGLASAMGAVLVFILYIIEDVLNGHAYHNKLGLWLLPLLLYLLVSRIWLKAHRSEMGDDPVEFVTKDRASLVMLALIAAGWALSWLGPVF